MLFQKHNSNTSAHEVNFKSLKSVITNLGEMQTISNFCILNELCEYGRFVFKFCSRYTVGDWAFHFQFASEMLPWYFAYDHLNYARYLPVYIYEMLAIPKTNSSIAENLVAGDFVVHQQNKYSFSQISMDQTTE